MDCRTVEEMKSSPVVLILILDDTTRRGSYQATLRDSKLLNFSIQTSAKTTLPFIIGPSQDFMKITPPEHAYAQHPV